MLTEPDAGKKKLGVIAIDRVVPVAPITVLLDERATVSRFG